MATRAAAGLLLAAALGAGCTATAPVTAPPVPPSPATSPGTSATVSPAPSVAAPNPLGLTDEQLAGQLFATYLYGSGPDQATAAQRAANLALYGEPTPGAVVRRWHLGGVILLDHNALDPRRSHLSTGAIQTAAQLAQLTGGLQAAAAGDTRLPLLIGTDQEGGPVQRIPFLSNRPSERTLSAEPPASIECSYYSLGTQLAALGVNQDYAPDADVGRTSGGVIGVRSFGPDPATDAADVTAAVAGLQTAGVVATLKHWPGHGSTSTDSHAALAVVHRSRQSWTALDLPPFRGAFATARAVMVGHLALPSVDSSGLPATLSPALVRGELLGREGFAGLVVTDSLWMQPARVFGSPGQVAVQAVEAGDDLLLEPPDLPAMAAAVVARMRQSLPFRRQVDAAFARIQYARALRPGQPPAGCR